MNGRDFEILLALLGKHIEFADKERYRDNLPPAEKEKEKIDITDSPFLALAPSLGCRIWSDDKHLRKQSMVDVLTTDDMVLKILNIRL